MRIGLLGGSFDPPHVGHLLAASDACDVLRLDRAVFIPNARQPLKDGEGRATPGQRLEMTRLTIAGDSRFAVDGCEAERGGVSYSVDTLEALAARTPGDERFFLVGADIIRTFAMWRAPDRVARLARIAILRRRDDGGPVESTLGVRTGETAGDEDGAPSAAALVQEILRVAGPGALEPVLVPTRRIDVSSTEIRERVRTGRSIRGFVMEGVEAFIREHRLYQ